MRKRKSRVGHRFSAQPLTTVPSCRVPRNTHYKDSSFVESSFVLTDYPNTSKATSKVPSPNPQTSSQLTTMSIPFIPRVLKTMTFPIFHGRDAPNTPPTNTPNKSRSSTATASSDSQSAESQGTAEELDEYGNESHRTALEEDLATMRESQREFARVLEGMGQGT